MSHLIKAANNLASTSGPVDGSTDEDLSLDRIPEQPLPFIDWVQARTRLVRFDPRLPLYRQLADLIRGIEEPAQADRLPTERRLAKELCMARVTVRKALADLEQEGRIKRRQGAGTYLVISKQNHPSRDPAPESTADDAGLRAR